MTASTKQAKVLKLTLYYVGYVFLACVFIAPLIYLFVSAFKDDMQIVSDMSSLRAFMPYGELTLENFTEVFRKFDFWRYFRNSSVITVIDVVIGTLINGAMGYALGMLHFKGRNVLIACMIGLTIIPTEAVIINRFMVANNLGILNTITGLVLPNLATPMYIFLFYKHFLGMPKELNEAAVMDGMGYVGIWGRIMMPLSKPIIATVAIMAFIRTWGDLLWPSLVTRDDTYRTLPQVLRQLYADTYTFWGQIFAFGALMTIPVLIVFLLFQKQFVQSMAASGIKG